MDTRPADARLGDPAPDKTAGTGACRARHGDHPVLPDLPDQEVQGIARSAGPNAQRVLEGWNPLLQPERSGFVCRTARRSRVHAQPGEPVELGCFVQSTCTDGLDRKSTRLNSSHSSISYAVFCLKKKKKNISNEFSLMRQKTAKSKGILQQPT